MWEWVKWTATGQEQTAPMMLDRDTYYPVCEKSDVFMVSASISCRHTVFAPSVCPFCLFVCFTVCHTVFSKDFYC